MRPRDGVPYPKDPVVDERMQQEILSTLPQLPSQHLLMLSRAISNPTHQPYLMLGWLDAGPLQRLVLTHAVPRWLSQYEPLSCGVSKPSFEVTVWRSLPSWEARLYWFARVLEHMKAVDFSQTGEDTFYLHVPTYIHKYLNNLYICTADDGVDITFAGFCLVENHPYGQQRDIHLIESVLPKLSGVGRALVEKVKRKGYTVTGVDVLPSSEGFFHKMGVPYETLASRKAEDQRREAAHQQRRLQKLLLSLLDEK